MPKRRRIKDANIKFISLCPRGMNGLQTIYKAAEGSVTFQSLTKASEDFDERGQLVAAVWVPDRPDREGEWSTKEDIEKMVHSFARNGMNVDIRHKEKALPKEDAYIAESFIIQKGDPRFADLRDDETGELVDATGGWGTVWQINNPELRKGYRDGTWGGVSMAGPAVVVDEDPPNRQRYEKMRRVLDGDIDMKPEELAEALKKSNEGLVTSLLGGIQKMLTPKKEETEDKKKENEEIVFEGDLSNPEDVRKHLQKVQLSKLDLNDPKALEAHLASISKSDEKKDDEEEGKKDEEESDALKEAKRELALAKERVRKAEGKSNGPTDTRKEEVEVEKQNDELVRTMVESIMGEDHYDSKKAG